MLLRNTVNDSSIVTAVIKVRFQRKFKNCTIFQKHRFVVKVRLQAGGVGCADGGVTGAFTPMWLMVARKPLKQLFQCWWGRLMIYHEQFSYDEQLAKVTNTLWLVWTQFVPLLPKYQFLLASPDWFKYNLSFVPVLFKSYQYVTSKKNLNFHLGKFGH